MLGLKDILWRACAPDILTIIDISKTVIAKQRGLNNILALCTIKIEMGIVSSSLPLVISIATIDLILVDISDESFR